MRDKWIMSNVTLLMNSSFRTLVFWGVVKINWRIDSQIQSTSILLIRIRGVLISSRRKYNGAQLILYSNYGVYFTIEHIPKWS